MNPAQRGDLAVIVADETSFVIGEGVTKRTRYSIAVVTSVTREGLVKMVRDAASMTPRKLYSWERVMLVSRDRLDAEAVREAASHHTWPGHSYPPKPFDSIDEAREFVRPFLRAA